MISKKPVRPGVPGQRRIQNWEQAFDALFMAYASLRKVSRAAGVPEEIVVTAEANAVARLPDAISIAGGDLAAPITDEARETAEALADMFRTLAKALDE